MTTGAAQRAERAAHDVARRAALSGAPDGDVQVTRDDAGDHRPLAAVDLQEILYVGDDRVGDYDGARASGCQAALIGAGVPGGMDLREVPSVVK